MSAPRNGAGVLPTAAVYYMLLVCCCWGLTNPLLKQGSQGIEAIKRDTRVGQVAAEVPAAVTTAATAPAAAGRPAPPCSDPSRVAVAPSLVALPWHTVELQRHACGRLPLSAPVVCTLDTGRAMC